MPRPSLVNMVAQKEGVTVAEAQVLVDECREDLMDRLERGEMPDEILDEYFGLEPDWLDELI